MKEKFKALGLSSNRLYLTTVDFYFKETRSFGLYIEEYIKQSINRFDEDYPLDKSLEETEPEFYHFLIDDLSEKWWQFSRDFPAELRASYISQIYSGIDAHVARICEMHYNAHHIEKSWKDLKSGSEWGKKLKYLVKYADVDKTDLQKEWDLLDEIRMIRNQIVHHHTKIAAAEKDWDAITEFITKHPTLIGFKDSPDAIDRESGKPMYEAYPKHEFKLLIVNAALPVLLIDTAESFFKKLLPQIALKKPTS